MEVDLCEFTLKLLALSAGTWFWLWYLVWEYEYFRTGKRERKRWWEFDVSFWLANKIRDWRER